MARKKVDVDHGPDCIVRLLYCTLAAWCLVVANASVYTVRYNTDVVRQSLGFMGLDTDTLGISAQNDMIIEATLGVAGQNTKIYDYERTMTGFAADLTPYQAAVLRGKPGILSVEEDKVMYATTTHTYNYMALPQGAWNKSGGTANAGENVVIGVVDTGIYPDHPSFANTTDKPYPPLPTYLGSCRTDPRVPNGFCNGKIVGAQHFFQAAIRSGTANTSDPDVNSPLDGSGHGTHCAGTAAGNHHVPVVVHGINYGNASGTAPRARLAVYKALNNKGQGKTSDIIMAMEKAVIDKVHILSLSLGPSKAPEGNITFIDNFELACLGAIRNGVVVVHAAGNTGPGTSTITSWSPWIISVGATTTDRTYPSYLFTGDGKNFSGIGFAPPTPGTTNYPLIAASEAVLPGMVANPDFDCADETILNRMLIQGKILVCSYTGVPSFTGTPSALARTAAEANGAVATVVLEAVDLPETYSPGAFVFGNFSGISITGATAEMFEAYYRAARRTPGGVTGRLSGGSNAVYSNLPPKVAPFSSRGPDIYMGVGEASPTARPVTDVLKPTIVAPGVDIWAAWTPLPTTDKELFVGERFAMISGTSMATPHLAGVAALVKEMHSNWSHSAIASALSTTALPADDLNNALIAYDNQLDDYGQIVQKIKRPGNAFDFGSGFVHANPALDPGLLFDATHADYVKFLCSVGLVRPAAVYQFTKAACPPVVGLPTDLNLPSITIAKLMKSLVVPRTVTNVGPLPETYTVNITKPADVDVLVVPASFLIAPAKTQLITVTLTALKTTTFVSQTSFGSIHLIGDSGNHKVQIPVTVIYKTI